MSLHFLAIYVRVHMVSPGAHNSVSFLSVPDLTLSICSSLSTFSDIISLVTDPSQVTPVMYQYSARYNQHLDQHSF